MFKRTLALVAGTVSLLASPAAGKTGTVAALTASCQRAERTLASVARAAAFTSYDDFIGDSGNAPDFCAGEFVTNDNQTITIGIHAHNRAGFAPGDSYSIFLDTDLNASSGGGEI